MYVAAFGNVQGNLLALEAVLDAIDGAGIQTILNTGDSVVGGTCPNEVIDLLRTRTILSVQGERDRRVVHFRQKEKTLRAKGTAEEFEALRRTYEALRPDNLEFLRQLPRHRTLILEGISICLCHGTPTNQSEMLGLDSALTRFQRVRETANVDIIVSGGKAGPFSRLVDLTLFVNPGWVDADGAAAYAVIDTEVDPWDVRFHAVKM